MSYSSFFFFFSSRRRHTRLQGDWSSDVCSSDLAHGGGARLELPAPSVGTPDEPALARSAGGRDGGRRLRPPGARNERDVAQDRKSGVEGKRVDLGGRRIIKKKKKERRGTQ